MEDFMVVVLLFISTCTSAPIVFTYVGYKGITVPLHIKLKLQILELNKIINEYGDLPLQRK